MALETNTATEYGADLLVQDIAHQLDRCCDEVSGGCDRCPVRAKCRRLWTELENSFGRHLKIREYRIHSQKFYHLKRERNEILNKNSETANIK